LPSIGGWEFLLRLSESSSFSSVPVVVISSLDDRHMALTGGAAAVLQKPISRAQLTFSLANLGLHPDQGRTHSVLIVDDDPKSVEVIATFLPAPDYAVARAYGGNEAITLAQQLQPDVIFLDLMMPEVTGFDVVDALKSNAGTASIPILVVTAKQITALDRTALNSDSDQVTHITEKTSFNSISFIAEVRRALLAH
jgi:CheY-like chemotaxis protein